MRIQGYDMRGPRSARRRRSLLGFGQIAPTGASAGHQGFPAFGIDRKLGIEPDAPRRTFRPRAGSSRIVSARTRKPALASEYRCLPGRTGPSGVRSASEPADAILELILRLEQETSKARGRLAKSLRRLGFDPEMTGAQLAETLQALGAEASPLIDHPDYVVRVIPPVGPPELLHVRVKAGLAHHHGEEHVLMVPLEVQSQVELVEAAAAAAVGFYRSIYACPQCGERVTVALLHEQRPT